MSKSWKEFSDVERQQLEKNFSVKQNCDHLLVSKNREHSPAAPLFSELMSIIADPQGVFPEAMLESIHSNAKLSADFDLLLRRLAVCAIPRAAAASSGELTAREVGEYRLKLVPSRAAQGQVFLIITIPESVIESPQRVFAKPGTGELIYRSLPSPDDKNISVLLYEDEPLVRAISDPSSELFLI